MRLTERFLLPFFGPAQLGDQRAPRRALSDLERERDAAIRTGLVRVVGADGRAYVVERTAADGGPPEPPEAAEPPEPSPRTSR